jgi:hypothetical protein
VKTLKTNENMPMENTAGALPRKYKIAKVVSCKIKKMINSAWKRT